MIRVHNTLTRSKEEFHPIDPDLVRMYVCGPTVYNHSHLGHAKTYISFDVIRRHLLHRFGREHLLYVMNITDVGHLAGDADEGEDRVEAQARRENRSPFEIATEYEESFWEDMGRLNILRHDRTPHATDFIRQQVEMIERLVADGVAYEANGSVYFDVAAYRARPVPEGGIPYGGLSGRQVEDLIPGGRIESNPEKRSPHDFALWKRADESHFMQWYSPWGWGYPGWHIECSVMSQFYLGTTFDIHGGGMDNKFPHHECEVAQSQAANGRPFARYWLHNNMLNTGGKKMGKSLGNATNLKSLFERFDPMAIRFFIVQSQYNSQLELDFDAIDAAATGYEKLRRTMERLDESLGRADDGHGGNGASSSPDTLPFFGRFLEAMDDDFNTPVAIGSLFEGVGELNRLLAAGEGDIATLARYRRAFEIGFDRILGLRLFHGGGVGEAGGEISGKLIDILLQLRTEARSRKDFATSDAIRDRLLGIGVILEDTREGTRWSVGRRDEGGRNEV